MLLSDPSARSDIKDVAQADFTRDVVTASKDKPVIADFWAPWCGPCKTLTPMLEDAVRKANGRVTLAKINIDQAPQLAQQLRIQSVPSVLAFWQGRPVDGFNGQVPASRIAQLIAQLTSTSGGDETVEVLLEQAQGHLANGDALQAGLICEQIMQNRPDYLPAIELYLRCLLAKGDAKSARRTIDALPGEVQEKLKISGVIAHLELVEQATVGAGDIDQLRKDPAARLDLARAYFIAGQSDKAFEVLLAMINDDRNAPAKADLLSYFHALGASDPKVAVARKSLSKILFS